MRGNVGDERNERTVLRRKGRRGEVEEEGFFDGLEYDSSDERALLMSINSGSQDELVEVV